MTLLSASLSPFAGKYEILGESNIEGETPRSRASEAPHIFKLCSITSLGDPHLLTPSLEATASAQLGSGHEDKGAQGPHLCGGT